MTTAYPDEVRDAFDVMTDEYRDWQYPQRLAPPEPEPVPELQPEPSADLYALPYAVEIEFGRALSADGQRVVWTCRKLRTFTVNDVASQTGLTHKRIENTTNFLQSRNLIAWTGEIIGRAYVYDWKGA